MNRNGCGPHPLTCPSCGAFLQAYGDRGRCPWTQASDRDPGDAIWPCRWPRENHRPDSVLPSGMGWWRGHPAS